MSGSDNAAPRDVIVHVDRLSKKYCRAIGRSMGYAVLDIGRDLVGQRDWAPLRPGEFWSLRDVSFDLVRGESLAVVGANGAGKSTLLKMLAGIIKPDGGCVYVGGRVVTLIDLNVALHPALTGRENVYTLGALFGLTRSEIDRRFDEIAAFSELDASVIDAPVRTYSSGMCARLSFALATHADADLLLIDELLTFADRRFLEKAYRRLSALRDDGASLIIVSHNAVAQQELCDRAMLLDAGCVIRHGSIDEVLDQYGRTPAGLPWS